MLRISEKSKKIWKHVDIHQQYTNKIPIILCCTLTYLKKQNILFIYRFLQLLTLTSCLPQQQRLQYWEGLQFFRISTVIQYHILAWYKEHMCGASKGLVNCHVDSAQYAPLHFFSQIMYCFHQTHCSDNIKKLWNNSAISAAEGS